MFGPSCAGIREGRTSTEGFLPGYSPDEVADQLAGCSFADNSDPDRLLALVHDIERESRRQLWVPQQFD